MTIVIRCHRCQYVLYRGEEIITPEEVVKKFGYRCPRCMAVLSSSPKDILIETSKKRGRRLLLF